MHQVLFLTNDAGACTLLVLQLVRCGCTVRVASTDALQELESIEAADVVVAELDLGDERSELVLRALSASSPRVPLLVLTPSAPLEARLRAFEAGVDDVLVVPCAPPELVARIRAVMRRSAPREHVGAAQHPVSLGAAVLYPESRALVRDGCTHVLRPKEYALLAALLERRGRIVARRELLAEVWGYAAGTTTRTVDTHIVRLRRLVERDPARPQLLLTVTKLGYRLALDTEARRAS